MRLSSVWLAVSTYEQQGNQAHKRPTRHSLFAGRSIAELLDVPMVGALLSSNWSAVKRISSEDLPTPESPTSKICSCTTHQCAARKHLEKK